MSKIYHIVLLISLTILVNPTFAQSTDTVPQKVYRYCYVVKPKAWYQNQEKLWNNEILKDPRNEQAWYNYFFAARYGWAQVKGQSNPREVLMDSIYQEMGKAIPHSWVYHYIHYYNYATDFSRLEKAYLIDPKAPDLYWEFIKEYTLKGQNEKSRKFCRKLYESRDISTGIYNLNYNILNSAAENSILFTSGDNDTYPAWVLQRAKGIRTDVLVLSLHGTFGNRDYLKSSLEDRGIYLDIGQLSKNDIKLYIHDLIQLLQTHYPETGIHFSAAMYEPYITQFKDHLHLTGLVYTYSNQRFDSDKRNKKIIENDLRLDYLEYDWYADLHVSEPLVNQMNVLYVEPFIKLATYYYKNKNINSARKFKQKALLLSKRVNNQELIKSIKEIKIMVK